MKYWPKINTELLSDKADVADVRVQSKKSEHSNLGFYATVTLQAGAAIALGISACEIQTDPDSLFNMQFQVRDNLTFITGVGNAIRSAGWMAWHMGVKEGDKLHTLSKAFNVEAERFKQAIVMNFASETQKMSMRSKLWNMEKDLKDAREGIKSVLYKYEDRNIAHTRVNMWGSALGVALYIPVTMHGAHEYIDVLTQDIANVLDPDALKSLLNSHFGGGLITMGGYGLWWQRFKEDKTRLNTQFDRVNNGELPYNPKEGVHILDYNEQGKPHKETWYKKAPLACFFLKGVMFFAEGSPAMMTSGTLFGFSGAAEIAHEEGRSIKAAWNRQLHKHSQSKSIHSKVITTGMRGVNGLTDGAIALTNATKNLAKKLKKNSNNHDKNAGFEPA